jgi:hypothetical protein
VLGRITAIAIIAAAMTMMVIETLTIVLAILRCNISGHEYHNLNDD